MKHAIFAVRLLVILAALAIPVARAASPEITPVTGFRNAAEVDPFADADKLIAVSRSTSVAGLAGVGVAVKVGCYDPDLGDSFLSALFGEAAGPTLGFGITLTGADLDIEVSETVNTTVNLFGPNTHYVTTDQTVQVKMRFDDREPESVRPGVTDPHHVEFTYADPASADGANQMTIGFSADGYPIYLRLDLGEPALRNIIHQCHDYQQQVDAKNAAARRKAAEERKTEETKHADTPVKTSAPDDIFFARDSALLTDQAQNALRDMANRIKLGDPGMAYELHGSIGFGSPAEKSLARARAETIEEFLYTRGIDRNRMIVADPERKPDGGLDEVKIVGAQPGSPSRAAGQASPVSVGLPPASPVPAGRAAIDGTWIDPRTHLMWTAADNGQDIAWGAADQYCRTLSLGGVTGWRLPSTGELGTLIDLSVTRPTTPLKMPNKSYEGGTQWDLKVGDYWNVHVRGPIALTGPIMWTRDPGNRAAWRTAFILFKGESDSFNEVNRIARRCVCVTGPR